MELAAYSDYYEPSVAVFDPEKVLERVANAFPTVSIDDHDLAQAEVESLLAFLDTNQTPKPQRNTMLRQIRAKAARVGPVYRFQLNLPPHGLVTGKVGRYNLLFRSECVMETALESALIRFLQSLHLGALGSDTETPAFRTLHPEDSDYWVLASNPFPPR